MSIAVNAWFEDYVRYDKSILPRAGGWVDQDNAYCEVMQLIHGETDRQTAEAIAKIKRDQQDQQKG